MYFFENFSVSPPQFTEEQKIANINAVLAENGLNVVVQDRGKFSKKFFRITF